MTNKPWFLILIMLAALTGCTNDSESDLLEIANPDPDPEPVALTYNGRIKAIIDRQCVGCHADPPRNGAPFPLANYDQVSVRVDNGSLLEAIVKLTGESGAMPPSGRMPQNTIDLIDQWIDEGALEE